MEETAASAFAAKSLFPTEAPTAATGEMVGMSSCSPTPSSQPFWIFATCSIIPEKEDSTARGKTKKGEVPPIFLFPCLWEPWSGKPKPESS